MKTIEYDSNNSGGVWWLTEDDWKQLEKGGWVVDWRNVELLGAKATSAKRMGLSLDDAITEFEKLTGQDACAAGCECCGQPHNFNEATA
jgi:hypothetical protein